MAFHMLDALDDPMVVQRGLNLGGRWMLDVKTSGRVYGETALQLAAYAEAVAAGVDPFPGMPDGRAPEPNPDRGRHREKTARRRERKAKRARGGSR